MSLSFLDDMEYFLIEVNSLIKYINVKTWSNNRMINNRFKIFYIPIELKEELKDCVVSFSHREF